MASDVVKVGGVNGAGNRLKTIGRRGLKIVEEMAAKGHPDVAIAKQLGIFRGTFTEICKRQPEVQEALERGRGQLEHILVHSLLERAVDPGSKGGSTAAIFLLKSRCGYEGTPVAPTVQNVTNTQNILNIQLPSAMDMDEYMKRVSAGSPPVIKGDAND